MRRLILPDTRYLDSYLEALREGFRRGDDDVMSEEQIAQIKADPFVYFGKLNSQGGFFTPPDGIERPRVPHALLWLIVDDDFVGSIWIRYALNDFLEKHAGHAGYGIRPKYQGRGYGKMIMRLALENLKERRIEKVTVTADQENPASGVIIRANGGILLDARPSIFHKGNTNERFEIDLTKPFAFELPPEEGE